MSRPARAPTLRGEIIRWYLVVLLLALGVFSGLTFVLMRQALERSVRTSLRQSAEAVENLYVPPGVARTHTEEKIFRLRHGGAEVIRRRTALATGDTIETWFARNDDAEEHALRTFALIAMLLIPLSAVLAGYGGRGMLERLLAPLHRLVDATHRIGIDDLSQRVEEPERPAELQELATSFNGMLTRLERAVATLERFTADASHELRTPLTSIKGTIQVALARQRSAPELEETLVEVLEETEWMLRLVDDLLTLARGEEGARGERIPVDLSALLGDVAEVAEALAAGRPVKVHLDAPSTLWIQGSPGQLRQVFLNLASNAVKFTESGTITISAEAVPDGPTAGDNSGGRSGQDLSWVEVRVEDTGVGIAPDELPHVFDRFYRGDTARAPGGTGLGLAIARLLVEQHGGTIDVQSQAGRGTVFRVRIPAALRSAQPDAT